MNSFQKKIEEKNKYNRMKKLLFGKTMKLSVLDVSQYTFDNTFKFYDKIEDFIKEDFEYSISIQNSNVIELIISKNDKSICFEINDNNEIKCITTWASLEENNYGFAEVEDYLNLHIWEWLEV